MSSKILVVDDSPTELRMVADSLRDHGFSVITATNGSDALSLVDQEAPDLIVLDILMPRPNGYQICRQLKRAEATEHIKIILLSSKDQPSDRFWGLRQGADAYLMKPYVADDLHASIKQLI